MKYYPTYFPARHALSVGLTVFLAALVNYYFAFSENGWIILTAFLVSQTTRGTPLRQGIIFSFIIMVLIVLISIVVLNITTMELLRNQIIDVCIGAAISIVCNQFFLPVHLDVEFRQSLIPLLKTIRDKSTLALPSNYPEWVYEVGFNPGLRSGFRFFLLHLDWIAEISCSINYLLPLCEKTEAFQAVSEKIATVMQKNDELLDILLEYFESNTLKGIHSDFTSDMAALEQAVRHILPGRLELLDISPDYVRLAALVRDMKDIRQLLLQLVMSVSPIK